MDRSKAKRQDNTKLRSLIFASNRVQFELIEINKFWRDLAGQNVILFLSLNILLAFIAIHVDLRLEIILLTVIVMMYMTCIYGTFSVANRVPAQVSSIFGLICWF